MENQKPNNPALTKPAEQASPAVDVEAQHSTRSTPVQAIVERWNREDLMKRGALVLRGAGFVLSLLSFIIMASNKHGDWKDFDRYEEYRYLLGIAILSTLYTAAQVSYQVYIFATGKELISPRTSSFINFFGDQIVAYLLISAASTAIPLTNRMREGADNIFTDASAASISMAFFAFLALALSAMISGFKLSHQTYI